MPRTTARARMTSLPTSQCTSTTAWSKDDTDGLRSSWSSSLSWYHLALRSAPPYNIASMSASADRIYGWRQTLYDQRLRDCRKQKKGIASRTTTGSLLQPPPTRSVHRSNEPSMTLSIIGGALNIALSRGSTAFHTFARVKLPHKCAFNLAIWVDIHTSSFLQRVATPEAVRARSMDQQLGYDREKGHSLATRNSGRNTRPGLQVSEHGRM